MYSLSAALPFETVGPHMEVLLKESCFWLVMFSFAFKFLISWIIVNIYWQEMFCKWSNSIFHNELCFIISFPIMEQNTDQKQVSADQDQSSMLKVICNQRDRFRARLRETEEVRCSPFCTYLHFVSIFI